MDDFDINEALRVYFDSDETGAVRPYGMHERVRDRYGADSSKVEAAVDQALTGLLDVPQSMRFGPLQAIAEFATRRARLQRPELKDDVCRAIGNYVSYGFR
jgi:hypothetical protein